MSIFRRIFKLIQSESHSVVDNLEDPVKLTEQGIRDLKKDYQKSIEALAEAKAVCTGVRRKSKELREVASDYENKAILLVKKAERGELGVDDADRLATEALNKKEKALQQATQTSQSLAKQDQLVQNLEANVKKLRSQIQSWESELTILKSRAKIAGATKKLNKQLSHMDSSSTISMLEKMKDKVNQEESLAQSYGEITQAHTHVDHEIEEALRGGSSSNLSGADKLAALKERLGQASPSHQISEH